jgi:hypothetical protein
MNLSNTVMNRKTPEPKKHINDDDYEEEDDEISSEEEDKMFTKELPKDCPLKTIERKANDSNCTMTYYWASKAPKYEIDSDPYLGESALKM